MSSLRESTLTTPSDRNISQQFKLDTTSEPLTNGKRNQDFKYKSSPIIYNL